MTQNKVWFVTGASKGLGLSIVRHILDHGGRVAATSRSKPRLIEALGDLSSKALLPLEVDLVDEASVRAAVSATLAHFGSLDVIVNNAGYGQMGTAEEVSDTDARASFDVNVFGVLNVLRAALPHLREKRAGHVFNIASVGGLVGAFPGWGIYCGTKFALAGISEGLHADLAPLGIHVTLVYPGYFRTEFLSQESVGRPSRRIADYEAAREVERQHIDSIHGTQAGDPDKLAEVLMRMAASPEPPLHLFLGSDALAMAEQKLGVLRDALVAHREEAISTDFAD